MKSAEFHFLLCEAASKQHIHHNEQTHTPAHTCTHHPDEQRDEEQSNILVVLLSVFLRVSNTRLIFLKNHLFAYRNPTFVSKSEPIHAGVFPVMILRLRELKVLNILLLFSNSHSLNNAFETYMQYEM